MISPSPKNVLSSTAITLLALPGALSVIHGINPYNPKHQASSEPQYQYGYNDCQNYPDSATGNCQNVYMNSLDDFCLFSSPTKKDIGDAERETVAYCNHAGHGTRLMPNGTITGAQWLIAPQFFQITGTGDFTKINDTPGDEGGELDPHGYDGLGNPIGGVMIANDPFTGKLVEITEWAMFVSYNQFCVRGCWPSTDAVGKRWCPHIYDEMGCQWNMPGAYKKGVFETCKADDGDATGEYVKNGKTTTWTQGMSPTPAAHAAPKSSDCVKQATVTGAIYTTAVATKKTTTTTKAKTTTTTKAAAKTTTTTKAAAKTTTTTKSSAKTTTTTKAAVKTTTTKSSAKATTTTKAAVKTTTTTKAAVKSTTTTKKATTTTKKAVAATASTKQVRDHNAARRGLRMNDEDL